MSLVTQFDLDYEWYLIATRLYRNELIIRTIQSPFSRKRVFIVFQQSPMFEIIIPISEYLHLVELEWGSLNVY